MTGLAGLQFTPRVELVQPWKRTDHANEAVSLCAAAFPSTISETGPRFVIQLTNRANA